MKLRNNIISMYKRFTKNRGLTARYLNNLFLDFYKAGENLNYNMVTNGENYLLKKLSESMEIKVVFDVGGNIGEWTTHASKFFPHATIHSFELVPKTFEKLRKNCSNLNNVICYDYGLADNNEAVGVFVSDEKNGLSTCISEFTNRFHNIDVKKIQCDVMKGDDFCINNNINEIDLLKVDVEGYEHNVLKGFENMLKENRIKIIQFEYGYINIETHFLLKDYYDLFKKYDMLIGKLYPKYVDFKDYTYFDENFFGPNYIAVSRKNLDLINILKK